MTFHANGKLLLTGEYFVLDGATALALPTKVGQSLFVEHEPDIHGDDLFWCSVMPKDSPWYSALFQMPNPYVKIWDGTVDFSEGLIKAFEAIEKLKPNFWSDKKGMSLTTNLEFPHNWGLGSSSTLIWLLAKWANIDPFALNDLTFGGSAYDIACAGAGKPIFFERKNNTPIYKEVDFKPPFADNLYFVFLNQKQNSREGIARYREKAKKLLPPDGIGMFHQYFDDILALTNSFHTAANLIDFEKLIIEHENLVASVIELKRAKSLYFNDFWGEIKSLGAWGGDFVLATSNRSFEVTKRYFEEKGFNIILKYKDLIL